MNTKRETMIFLLLSACLLANSCCNAQFNEPPGQRREQTYRVREFELSNINQHYPGDLRYYCTFRGKWSKERHPNDFPKAASFSAPTIMSHSKDWRMWTGTETVTAGVEYMAEEGFPTILYNEFQNAGWETLHMIVGDRMFNTSDSQELPPINVTYSHPWLSSMSKISPSPDWFVGFSDFRTISYDTETFYNRFVIQSYVWDAGTDDGQNYLSFDRDLDPQVPCMRFCVPPDMGSGGAGTFDSNIVHKPGTNQIHHPTGNTKKCPDKAKGRVQVPRAGQFLDYSASYIPFPAEYECVLRVGDTEVYAGFAFEESQIRPPKYVARPDDDFLDGISPYDQPAYDNYVESLKTGEDIDEEEEGWNKHLLWLLLLLVCCCCPCVIAALYFLMMARKKRRKLEETQEDELHLNFVDEGMVGDDYSDEGMEDKRGSFVNDNIDEYEDTDDYDSNSFNNMASGKGGSVGSTQSMRSSSRGRGGNVYSDDNGSEMNSSYNTGVSTGDDYDSWLAAQNVSQSVEYEEEDSDNYGNYSDDESSNNEDVYLDSERNLKGPSLKSLNTIT